jgi:CTP synthase (UTP-ammonia lyase)
MKYVVVMGGVISGLGKGVTASSIGVVLKACGLRVTSIKIGTNTCFFFPSSPSLFAYNI